MGAITGSVLASLVALSGACSSASSLVPAGGECFVVTDCAAGLVCLPRKDGTRVCGSDLSSVEKPAASGSGATDAGTPMADAAPGDDATTATDATTPPRDAGPKDAAPPKDATPPPVDAGADADDAASDATGD